jgi:hypothetical protein
MQAAEISSEVPQTPTLTPLGLAHLCARYLQTNFKIELSNARSRSSQPIGASMVPPARRALLLPLRLTLELDCIALTLVKAFLNPGR